MAKIYLALTNKLFGEALAPHEKLGAQPQDRDKRDPIFLLFASQIE
jgi:hypothetical protein